MTQPVFESLKLNTKKICFANRVKAECKTDIQSKDVSKILSVNAVSLGGETEVGETVKSKGRVVFFVTYVSNDGEIKRNECGAEFSANFTEHNLPQGAFARGTYTVEKTEYVFDGEYVLVSATLKICVTATAEEQLSAFTGGEKIFTDNCEICYDKPVERVKGGYPVDEEFEFNYQISKVLSQSSKVAVTAVQCGVGSVIADGEIYFSMLLLQKTEKSDIIREDKVIPFRMEVEAEEAMPSMRALARLKEKAFKTDIEVNAEENKSTLSVQITLAYDCDVFMETVTEVAIDAFCVDEEVKVISEEYAFDAQKDVRIVKQTVSARAQTAELPIGARLTAVGGERAELVSVRIEDSKIKTDGALSAVAYYKDSDGGVFAYNLEIPFEAILDAPDGVTDAEVVVVVEKVSAKTISITQTEITAEMVFSVYPCEKKTITVIKDVQFIGEKAPCQNAISVYIPMEGERLWTLAKRLGVCPDELVATNPDLQFPLTGKERIVVYRKR